jgi:hypothetical protein
MSNEIRNAKSETLSAAGPQMYSEVTALCGFAPLRELLIRDILGGLTEENNAHARAQRKRTTDDKTERSEPEK